MELQNQINIMRMQGIISPLQTSNNLKDLVDNELTSDLIDFESKIS